MPGTVGCQGQAVPPHYSTSHCMSLQERGVLAPGGWKWGSLAHLTPRPARQLSDCVGSRRPRSSSLEFGMAGKAHAARWRHCVPQKQVMATAARTQTFLLFKPLPTRSPKGVSPRSPQPFLKKGTLPTFV